MKTTIEQLNFPCDIKNKPKMKASLGNLNIKYIDGHIINIDKTNLSITDPHKIIVKDNSNTLIDYFYEDNDKYIYPFQMLLFHLLNLLLFLIKRTKIRLKREEKLPSLLKK